MTELYKKHRPKKFKAVVGQGDAVGMIQSMIKAKKVPHTILFSGPSGCGKTTMARILKDYLGCGDNDCNEVNCADFRGIEMVRDIRQRMGLAPISGSCRVWIIDEAHQLSRDAQNAFLKILEDTPPHVYFMLATTDPQKLLPTIRTRCTEIKARPILQRVLYDLIIKTADKEGAEISEEVVERIAQCADGSARKALVLLHQVIDLEDDEAMLSAIDSADSQKQAIEIARALLNPRTKWSEMAAILKGVDEDPESLRHMILSYATNVLLGGGKMAPRAGFIIEMFSENFYDTKKAGLVASCYGVINSK